MMHALYNCVYNAHIQIFPSLYPEMTGYALKCLQGYHLPVLHLCMKTAALQSIDCQ
jgi:hypothetical protein